VFLGAGPKPVLFGRVVTGRAFGINSLGHCVSAHLHRGLSRLLHTELDWLDVPEQVVYKLNVMVFNCLLSQAPPYLWNCANQSQVSHHGNISDPPPDSSWLYRTTNSAFMTDGLSVSWSVGLEFSAGQLAESDYWQEQFQTISEDVSVCNVLMHSAH